MRRFEAKRWNLKDPGPHRNRWRELGNLLAGSEDAVKVVWVKAHVTAEMQVKLQVDVKIPIGNECADALAKRGAALGGITMSENA